ncbi:hypothetical protein G5B38_02270 [Pseudohalocynthiibacter aestuariivivens]|uniref:Uncharacterized protein n=1 Tax=Roseovarius pelagicus TaxID=2980108 RepID=A0ABY6DBW5_9RHOB|nr:MULTISPECIES: hypothetical protein [Rhodobacterales]QIE44444.1 hypothetical protein G5B38_02270 [Pseudohalocynthiibacter aestuariivivens]UXX83639.1 hypothetical protein N7U68_02880 [Roseovarius pelagicus]
MSPPVPADFNGARIAAVVGRRKTTLPNYDTVLPEGSGMPKRSEEEHLEWMRKNMPGVIAVLAIATFVIFRMADKPVGTAFWAATLMAAMAAFLTIVRMLLGVNASIAAIFVLVVIGWRLQATGVF